MRHPLPHPLTLSIALPTPLSPPTGLNTTGKHAHIKVPDDCNPLNIHTEIHQDLPTPVQVRMVRPQFKPVEKFPPMVPMVMGSTFHIIPTRHGTRLQEGVPSRQFYRDATSLGMTHDLFLLKGEPVWLFPWHHGGKTFVLHRMGLPRRTLTLQAGTFLDVAVTYETFHAPRADACL